MNDRKKLDRILEAELMAMREEVQFLRKTLRRIWWEKDKAREALKRRESIYEQNNGRGPVASV